MLKLSDFLNKLDPEQVLFVSRDRPITGADFLADVKKLYQSLMVSSAKRFALCYLDSYRFTVALFAVLAAKRQVVLLPNNQPGTLREFAAEYDAVLDDNSDLPLGNVSFNRAIDAAQEIIFFTSGSTGKATKVVRDLDQFQPEMLALEDLFGEQVANKSFYSTVSHQHLYGFSFFILWPLWAGRTIQLPMLTQAEAILALIKARQDLCLISSPAILQRLGTTVDSKKLIIFSSCSLLKAEDAKALANYPIEILGSTETSVVAYRQQTNGNKDWTALPCVQVSRDPNSGCLSVKSPFFSGCEAFIMGDKVEFSDDGRFQLLGRADRIAKIEGKRVSLSELEQRLTEHEFVLEAYAILLEKKRQYTAVLICLSPAGIKCLTQHGKRWLNKQLSASLHPFFDTIVLPKQFRYLNQIPRNSQSKIVQSELAKLFEPSVLREPLRLATQEIADDHVEFDLYIPRELLYFSGHFPEQPILPGVAQINWAINFACEYFNLDKKNFLNIGQLKFTHVILPEAQVKLSLKCIGQSIIFNYAQGDKVYSLGKFQIGVPL